MNWHVTIENGPKKPRKLSKKDKFITNERKICLSCYNFIFFMKLRLIVFVSHVILSENLLNETKKWYRTEILNLFWTLHVILSNSMVLAFFSD